MLCVYVTAQHACVLVIPREVFDKAVEFVPEDFQAIAVSYTHLTLPTTAYV